MISSPVRQWLIDRARLEPSLLEGPGYVAAVGDALTIARQSDEMSLAQVLDADPILADQLISAIAVPETWFFRYPHSYRLLLDHLTTLVARGAPVRILSYGCATGEEPYSLAMTCLHAGLSPSQIEIIAADRSSRALDRARDATFGAASFRGELPAWSLDFFQPASDKTTLTGSVRECVRFVQATSPRDLWLARGSLDAVFCRNVLIYLSAEARQSMLLALKELLAPSGLLFVGHAEPIIASKAGFRPTPQAQAFALEHALVRPSAIEKAATLPGRVDFSLPTNLGHRIAPSDASLLDEARALADAGNMFRSESILSRLVARASPSAPALELLGLVRLSREDHREARAFFERAVAIEPDRPASLLQLAMLCEAAGDAAAARDYWSRVRQTARAGGERS